MLIYISQLEALSTKSEALNKLVLSTVEWIQTSNDKKGISNIEQGISNDEVRLFAGLLTDKVGFDFRIFSAKICLILVGRGGSFEFLRGLQHVGLFFRKWRKEGEFAGHN